MANVAAHKNIGLLGDQPQLVRMVYDFDNDGGLQGNFDLGYLGDEGYVIVNGWTSVKTACTSGGLATVIIGIQGGDVDAVLASTAVAALTQDATFPLDAAGDGAILGDANIRLTIGTEDLTAGKIEVCLLMARYIA